MGEIVTGCAGRSSASPSPVVSPISKRPPGTDTISGHTAHSAADALRARPPCERDAVVAGATAGAGAGETFGSTPTGFAASGGASGRAFAASAAIWTSATAVKALFGKVFL